MMVQIKAESIINAPKDKVWEVVADFPAVMNFHPFVPKSYSLNNTPHRGVGSERRCNLNEDGTNYVDERVVRYTEGESYDVDIYEGSQLPPVNNFNATIRVRSLSANQTVFALEMKYELKSNPIYWLMGRLMIPRFMNNLGKGVVAGAKYHIETGNYVESPAILKQITVTA